MIKIDKNIPIPKTLETLYPFATMSVGDSFEAPISKRSSLSTIATNYKCKKNKMFLIKKTSNDTVRVWRLI